MKITMRFSAVVLTTFLVAPAWADDVAALDAADEEAEADASTVAQDEPLAAEVEEAVEEQAEVALSEDGEAAEEQSLIHPFSATFSMRDTFPLGTIFRDSNTVTNFNLLSFSLSGGYQTPHEPLSLGLSLSASKYTSAAGGETFQREARFGDIGISAAYSPIWSDPDFSGLDLSGEFSFVLPTSEYSQFTNLYTTLSLGFTLSRAFGNLSLSLSIGVDKNFNSDTSVVVDNRDLQLDLFARDGGTENIGEGQIALDTGVLAEWGFSTSLGLSYKWFEGFSTSLSFGLANNWTYDNGTITESDELTSEFAEPGRGFGQSMSGSISASYGFLEYFSAGLALSTRQPVKTADNQSIRFPFWDLETGNLQNTTISLSLSASY